MTNQEWVDYLALKDAEFYREHLREPDGIAINRETARYRVACFVANGLAGGISWKCISIFIDNALADGEARMLKRAAT